MQSTDTTGGHARPVAAVVLAAGKGTRMKSDLPKVLHQVLGRTVVGWVLHHLGPVSAERTVVVVGHGGEQVAAALPVGVLTAVQEAQRGSGDALAAAMAQLVDFEGDVLVVNGDGALFTAETLQTVVDDHQGAGALASCLAITSEEALPYGRVIQGDGGSVERIVEAVDASADELSVRELNAGVYCFDAAALRGALPRLEAGNAKGELYVTDLLGIVRGDGGTTRAVVTGGPDELLGINTAVDLAVVEQILQRRVLEAHMLAGVTFSMPHTCLVEPTVQLAAGVRIEPGTILRGATVIEAGAVVGPWSNLTDTYVEAGASVVQSTCVEARVGPRASVGPYAYLRPGAQLAEESKVGTFVELKKTVLGARSKVPHLSYVGDATVGADSNIGAGNITANYRPELGRGKQPTRIGSGVRTGSDNVFVAPVSIGDGAFTGAGSIIVQDVPAGALAIARARQVNLQDYAQRLSPPSHEESSQSVDPHRTDASPDAAASGTPDARG